MSILEGELYMSRDLSFAKIVKNYKVGMRKQTSFDMYESFQPLFEFCRLIHIDVKMLHLFNFEFFAEKCGNKLCVTGDQPCVYIFTLQNSFKYWVSAVFCHYWQKKTEAAQNYLFIFFR